MILLAQFRAREDRPDNVQPRCSILATNWAETKSCPVQRSPIASEIRSILRPNASRRNGWHARARGLDAPPLQGRSVPMQRRTFLLWLAGGLAASAGLAAADATPVNARPLESPIGPDPMALKPPRSVQRTATRSGPSMLSTIAAVIAGAIAATIGVTTAVLTGGTGTGTTGGCTADTGDAGATTISLGARPRPLRSARKWSRRVIP